MGGLFMHTFNTCVHYKRLYAYQSCELVETSKVLDKAIIRDEGPCATLVAEPLY